MIYNFDAIPCREGTACEKYDRRGEVFGREDVIPLWIADMDFEVAPFITEAVLRRANHQLYGYGFRDADYLDSIVGWVGRRNGWRIEPGWLAFTPGVVAGFAFAIRAVTSEGDGVVIMPPVYPPFANIINVNGRRVVNNPLVRGADGEYSIDFDDLDRKLDGAKALLFCNPHNPTGRVFSPEELRRVGELCVKHGVVLISDEIHSDLIQKPFRHTHIASLSPEIMAQTITFIAPSKTFNIAGLSTSAVIIPDPALRKKFDDEFERTHAAQGNVFGTVALEAAYRQGDEWLDQLLEYIGGNMDYVCDFIGKNIPGIVARRPQGTYLLWLDCRGMGMEHDELLQFMVERAGLGFDDGRRFGMEGDGFLRMNLGTSRAVLERAMAQLKAAVDSMA